MELSSVIFSKFLQSFGVILTKIGNLCEENLMDKSVTRRCHPWMEMDVSIVLGCHSWIEKPHPWMEVSFVNAIHGWRTLIHGWHPQMRMTDDGHGRSKWRLFFSLFTYRNVEKCVLQKRLIYRRFITIVILDFLIFVVFLLIPAGIVHQIEPCMSYGESLWYSFQTLSTIGFGDIIAGMNIDKGCVSGQWLDQLS